MTENRETISQAMGSSIKDARQGALELRHGGPFGAAVILNGKVISVAHNTVIRDNDPTAHAEVNAIRAANPGIDLRRLKPGDSLNIPRNPLSPGP